MNVDHARALLGGYATGTLTKSERELLTHAALRDDELFAELVEADDLREVLADESFRQKLRARLRELQAGYRQPWRERLAGLFKARWMIPVSALAVLSTILLIRQGYIGESSPAARVLLGPESISALHLAGILETPAESEKRLEQQSSADPPKAAQGASISVDRTGRIPVYRAGDRQRVGFLVKSEARVLLIEERADGSSVRLFPNRFQSSTLVHANATILIPPAGQGDLIVEGPPGRRTLRLLIFPADVDSLQPGVDWSQLRGQARVVEKRYEVKP